MKLLPIILFAALSVKGQFKSDLPKHIVSVQMPREVYDEMWAEIQTLRHINDSLKSKLNTALEYIAYTCPIMENLYLKPRAGAYLLRSKDLEEIKRALMRYNKRYKK